MEQAESTLEKTPITKYEFLELELAKLINNYHRDRNRHKKEAVNLKILTVVLSASITILLGLTGLETFQNWFKNLALIFGALITVLSAYEAFFYPRILWIQETKVFSRLRDLQRQLLYYKTGNEKIETEMLDKIMKGIDAALQESLNEWMMLRGVSGSVIGPNTEDAQNKKDPFSQRDQTTFDGGQQKTEQPFTV